MILKNKATLTLNRKYWSYCILYFKKIKIRLIQLINLLKNQILMN